MSGTVEYGPDEGGRVRSRRAWARLFTVASWALAVVLLMAALAWTASGVSWIADLAANLSAQFLVVTAPLLVLWALTRRRALAAVALVACLSHVGLLSIGRAAYWPREAAAARPMGSSATTADASGVVRFFHYNANTKGRGQDIEQVMLADGPDVISIVGPPVSQQAGVIYGHHLADRFAGKLTREWQPSADGAATDVTPAFVVSRWPIRPWDTSQLGTVGRYLLAGVVERPGGEFGVIAVHPRSPRTKFRWERGNMVVEAVIGAVGAMRGAGLEVVVLTDLNATPTGYRSRRLYWSADLRRAKPLLAATGTYFRSIPAGLDANAPRLIRAYWPANVAIDDAVISGGIEVEGWSVEDLLASEHRPITVDLRIPFAAGGGGSTGK